jgi:putative tricarboxylic transport membrane protein
MDIVMGNWRGVFGAPGISAAQRAALTGWITALHATPQWREIVQRQGWDDAFLTGDEFTQFIARDEAETRQVLMDIGLAG